jgi:hypothetical protein
MARLAPLETRKRVQFTPPWVSRRGVSRRGVSRRALPDLALLARVFVAQRRGKLLLGAAALETLLLLIAVTPQTTWMNLHLPNGPIPPLLAPLAAALFYGLPTFIGAMCRRWYSAIALATLPAWFALGVFATIAAPRLGFAYLTQDTHAAGVIGTLELFAGMGLLGWIVRLAVKDGLARLERSR